MGMHQVSDGAGLLEETFEFIICYSGLQQLDGHLCIEIHMLAKVDLGKAAPANEADQAIIPQLLSYAVRHVLNCSFVKWSGQLPAMDAPTLLRLLTPRCER